MIQDRWNPKKDATCIHTSTNVRMMCMPAYRLGNTESKVRLRSAMKPGWWRFESGTLPGTAIRTSTGRAPCSTCCSPQKGLAFRRKTRRQTLLVWFPAQRLRGAEVHGSRPEMVQLQGNSNRIRQAWFEHRQPLTHLKSLMHMITKSCRTWNR